MFAPPSIPPTDISVARFVRTSRRVPRPGCSRNRQTERTPQPRSSHTAEDGGRKPGLKFLARSERGKTFQTAPRPGGTKPDDREASYGYLLSTLKHTSDPRSPELCLARFDELKSVGFGAFTKRHEPYWDILLNENLPQPVIDLPRLGGAGDKGFSLDTARRKRGKPRG
jgi:hypothetical protein